jgi:uncharacterized membrane protein
MTTFPAAENAGANRVWDAFAVAVAEFIVGIALLMLGGAMVLGRARIVAMHQSRGTERAVRAPMAWLVLGVILALAGLIQVLLAVT